MEAVPRGLMSLILLGVAGFLPWLTPLAALGLAIIMLLAAIFHTVGGEFPNIGIHLVLLVVAAVVTDGRYAVTPL